jgi:hypothetical protein
MFSQKSKEHKTAKHYTNFIFAYLYILNIFNFCHENYLYVQTSHSIKYVCFWIISLSYHPKWSRGRRLEKFRIWVTQHNFFRVKRTSPECRCRGCCRRCSRSRGRVALFVCGAKFETVTTTAAWRFTVVSVTGVWQFSEIYVLTKYFLHGQN